MEEFKMEVKRVSSQETKELIKQVDSQGRIVIPKKWRNKHLKNNKSVTLTMLDGEIIIKSHQPVDITKHFNSLKVNLKSDISKWDDVKRELLK